jgi:hypothetical protein
MMLARFIGWLRERTPVIKVLFFAFLVFAVAFDFVIERHEPHFFGDDIIGFWAFFGLIGCLGLIVVCKGLSHVWLQKDEDYYDR